VTQDPTEFYFTLIDDITDSEFTALAESAADYLKSIPGITQRAAAYQRGENPFLEIRVGQDGGSRKGFDAYDYVYRLRASFTMDLFEDGQPAFFWLRLQAGSWRAEVLPWQRERDPDLPDYGERPDAETKTRHGLGLYRSRRP
jgi:hypothetical protein